MATWGDISGYTWGELLDSKLTWGEIESLSPEHLLQIVQAKLERFQAQNESSVSNRELTEQEKEYISKIVAEAQRNSIPIKSDSTAINRVTDELLSLFLGEIFEFVFSSTTLASFHALLCLNCILLQNLLHN